jgi:hypothetical protein
MIFDKLIVWGFKNLYSTHSHIHDGLYRALRFMGKDAQWIDEHSHVDVNQPGTMFITNHDVACQLPVRDDCFYMIHGGSDSAECRARFGGLRNYLTWNVFIDWVYAYDDSQPFGRRPINRPEAIWVGEDAPFYPSTKHMDFRWATDLTPPEIEANKRGAQVLNTGSKVINYVGTYWRVNETEIAAFERACANGGIELRHLGAGQVSGFSYLGRSNVVSLEDNVRLVRESYFAPAIVGSHHLTEGYAPCRIFKNISYGQFGVTNSEKVQRLFGGRLIHDDDPYRLFFTARERLASVSQAELHSLMDLVAQKHTYVNRLEAVFKAVELISEG